MDQNDNYLKILNNNDEEAMRKFLLANGKKKPVSPIYFIPREEITKDDLCDRGE